MKKRNLFKKCAILFLAAALVCGSAGMSASAATTATGITYKSGGKTRTYTGKEYKVYYNGKRVGTTKKPGLMINSNIMIPYKQMLVKTGPKMTYKLNKATKKLTLKYNNITVKLTIDKKRMKVKTAAGTSVVKLNTAPQYVKYAGKRTLVIPAKAVLEKGFGFGYELIKKKLYITEPQTQSVADDGLTAEAFKNMTTSEFIATMGPIAQADYEKTGVLASVTLAQCIEESGWGKSELAQKANNLFGMKTSLSGNTWSGSAWDGKSSYTKKTTEYSGGKSYTITASFRKYSTVAQSVADHSAYLCNAKSGSSYRYAGLTSTKSYTKQLQIIKNGGYATSGSYVSNLTNLITKYNLTKYDK